MCVICNIIDKDFIDSALAVKDTITDEAMAIPLKASVDSLHSFDIIQSMLLNANLIAIIF